MDLQTFKFSLDGAEEYLLTSNVLRLLKKTHADELPPKWPDLARLFKLVRERKPFQILEFGSGFSTLTMAYALKSNWEEHLSSVDESTAAGVAPPKIVSVESSTKWHDRMKRKIIKESLTDYAEVVFSSVRISEYKNELCHLYDKLPDLVPDFVYLDGPDPATVEGSIQGLSFKNPRRTVMAADILKFESTLLPGFFMIIDGRTNNARFLQRNLSRSYDIQRSDEDDVTFFEMKEPRLGPKNIYGWEAYASYQATRAAK